MLFDIIKLVFKSTKPLVRAITKKGENASFNDLPVFEPMPPVYPRIKHVNFLKTFDDIEDMPESSKPIVETLVGDLLLAYAIDTGENYISVSQDTLNKHARNPEELRPMAEENALDAMREIRKHDDLVNSLTTRDNLIACSILYPALWRQIEDEMGGKILVAFPHRDTVLYVREDNEKAVSELQRIINEDIDFSDTHALSKSLYQLTGDNWQVSAII